MSNFNDSFINSVINPDPNIPLGNLSTVRERMDSLQQFLSEAVKSNTIITNDQMKMVNSEISNAIQQIITNGTALLACSQSVHKPSDPPDLKPNNTNLKPDPQNDFGMDFDSNSDIVEIDAVELLAEHVHFCEICGKGFKRDANLRMHMRAHGNQFKTIEALSKPDKGKDLLNIENDSKKLRFSCPFDGCNRNKNHKKFRALKSVICVRNHFKRSHCPKMYSCNRCNKKSFSVVADLKSHLKHCGESRWKCSCGTTFSRKDKLFGHMALFEGHMPAVVGDDEEKSRVNDVVMGSEKVHEEEEDEDLIKDCVDNEFLFFDGLLDGFGSVDGYNLRDVLGSSSNDNKNSSGWIDEMDGFGSFGGQL